MGILDPHYFREYYGLLQFDFIKVEDSPEWLQIKKAFPILNNEFSLDSEHNDNREELDKAINVVKAIQVQQFLHTCFVVKFSKYVRVHVGPEYCKRLKDAESNTFFGAVFFLYKQYQKMIKIVKDMHTLLVANDLTPIMIHHDDPTMSTRTKICGTLNLLVKEDLAKIITSYYMYDLYLEDPSTKPSSRKKCPNCQIERCSQCRNLLFECTEKLSEMHVLQNIIHPFLLADMSEYIATHIKAICEGDIRQSYLQTLETWLEEVVFKWLDKIYILNEDFPEHKILDDLKNHLKYGLKYLYTKQRIDQLFKIIIEYPDSLPVLEDIKELMPSTYLRTHFIQTLKRELKTRLLHPGVGTSDILTAYVATIRTLRTLDPSSQLLDAVTEPIHEYLRTRSDTIRCVVTSLTEDGPNDLAEELVSGEATQPEDSDDDDWMNWVPPPKNPIPSQSKTNSKSADIITMLINVYGSKELFVNEYRTLLADRLLSQLSCDTEKEIRYLELLKLRFGDAQLNYCEVMLKDIVDSKRINQRIKEDPNYEKNDNFISAMIVSAQFWPPFKDDKLELHPKVVKQMERFTSSFETLKGDRTLLWKNHLGVVDLEIQTGNKTLELTVSPLHATILLFFQENKEWSLKKLSKKMLVPVTALRRKMSYWQSQGLIAESENDVFVLEEDNVEGANVEADVEDDETESVMTSTKDQRNEELQTFWSYIVGMLTNLESLSLDRIHQMLKMFVFEGTSTEYTLEELQNLLDKKIREHQLIFSNGAYKLPK